MATDVDELTVAITADTSGFQAALSNLGKQSDTFAEIVMTKTENEIDTAQFALFDA